MLPLKKKKLLDSRSASEILKQLSLKDQQGKTKILQLMQDFHENGILLAIIFFALPVAVPLPYPPGFTTIMGIPLITLSIQMIIGSKQVYLPKKVNDYEISNAMLKKISDKVVPRLEFLEEFIKPRLSFTKSTYCEQFVGLVCLIASFAVILPIPFTNAIPAQGITIMALGLLNRDGWVVIAGFAVAVIGVAIAGSITLASFVALKYFFLRFF